MAEERSKATLQENIEAMFNRVLGELKDLKSEVQELKLVVSASSGPRRSSGKKRAPSKYNLYIGKCMRGTGKSMKSCAVGYKAAKADGSLDSYIERDSNEQ